MMRFRLYFVFIAVSVWTNFKGGNSDPSLSQLLKLLSPQEFLSNTGNSQSCPYSSTIKCPTPNTFRSFDGSCNNEGSPYRGKSDTPYLRKWTNFYADFATIPRTKSFYGNDLPSPREISLSLFEASADESPKKNNFFTVFARFVEHDLYDTKLFDGSKCCDGTNPTSNTCDNIELKAGDPYFSAYKRTCLPKANPPPSPTVDCKTAVHQQINANTHYLDLSNIYGSKSLAADELRTKTDGLLKESEKKLLPKRDLTDCQIPNPNPDNIHCFLAGDLRANNNPLLMALYTIWVRHHNKVAKDIKAILKDANDESIFQAARKIVIAEYQHIVYNEFLPALYSQTKLKPATSGYTNQPDKVNPDIFNTFSNVFTGLVDTLVRKDFTFNKVTEKLEKYWYNPSKLWETDGIKYLVEGSLNDAAGKIDRSVVKPLTDQYLEIAAGQGTDKVAVNIQQTRENGGINYFILYAIINKKFDADEYTDLTYLDTNKLTKLKALYPSVHDIELLPGVFSESPAATEEIGPTLAVIIEDQFANLKNGDRLYYEHKDVFKEDQLKEIKKITIAKIICDHADLANAPAKTFEKVDNTANPNKACSTFDSLDICLWSTANWSDWKTSGCRGFIMVYTRQCEILPGSLCKCTGLPFKFENCPTNLLGNLLTNGTLESAKSDFIQEFYSKYDDQGHELH